MKHLWLGIAAAALAACAANPSPIPMVGRAGDLSALAGEWVGEYRSVETGRTGSITFTLQAGRDTAFGDVLMVPKQAQGAGVVADNPGVPGCTAAQVITIRFVRIEGAHLSGTMDPYRCPDCGCLLHTVFDGVLRGDRIEGEFVTSHTLGDVPPQKGSWWVARKPPGSP